MGPRTVVRALIEDEHAREILSRYLPQVVGNPAIIGPAIDGPIQSVLDFLELTDTPVAAALWSELRSIPAPPTKHLRVPRPLADYPEDPAASRSTADFEDTIGVRETWEIAWQGPSAGNPYVEVELVVEVVCPEGTTRTIGAFYAGEGRYVARFLPDTIGLHTFRTRSNVGSLSGIHGDFRVTPSTARGPVAVHGTSEFAYANGEPYSPIGTTAYAWTHQSVALQTQTVQALRDSPFNKVRMAIFPKSYVFNENEPDRFPFERVGETFDPLRFDPRYFENLEHRISELGAAGIECDLILFHPYDRWGFADMGGEVDDFYVSYVVRRLSGFANVWWSLANEYDFIAAKDEDDWSRIAELIVREDPTNHLRSIHNGFRIYDFAASWASHCSIQKVDAYRTTENVTAWRDRWNKPVIVDETGYEGDLEQDWGQLPAFELVRRFWEATVRGGFASHGETYRSPDDVVSWAKGGPFRGESVARLGFLAEIVRQSPSGRLSLIRSSPRGGSTVGVEGQYEIRYLGIAQPSSITVALPEGCSAEIDIIDTWAMTIDTVEVSGGPEVKLALPTKPFLAVRTRVVG